MRRLDAALELWGRDGAFQDNLRSAVREGGVKPPHSKALRAFSWFLGAPQPTGMSDCTEGAGLTPDSNAVHPHRFIPFVIFTVSGLLLYEPAFFAFNRSGWFPIATFVGIPLLFAAVLASLRRSRRFLHYAPACFSFWMASVALFFLWLLDESPARWLGLHPESPPGRAIGKLADVAVMMVTFTILTRLFRTSFGSIYLQKGRLRLGLAIGLIGFAGMATFGVLEARALGIGMSRILGWTPWLLIFVLANGFFEELMFRGVFLKKFEPLAGTHLSNLATALVFAIGHAGVTYTSSILPFVGITFVFALVAGFVMQKTEAVWGSALFHAGADVVIMIGIFAGVKT